MDLPRDERPIDGRRLDGRLLVATPDLRDPNFDRTVVLVLEHGEGGALGVVLNRPTGTEVGDVLPGWDRLTAEPPVVFVGGPVQPEAVLAVARLRPGATPEVSAVLPHGLATVDLERDPGVAEAEVTVLRVFAGYAGWAPGQLEDEVVAGGWFVVDAAPDDVFCLTAGELWREVLARQPGRIAVFAGYPTDPSTN